MAGNEASANGAPGMAERADAEFAKSIPNLSVVQGREAYMKCSVRNLGAHKVSKR